MAEWYERDGEYPAGADRDSALRYLTDHWYAVVPVAHILEGKTDTPQNLLKAGPQELEPVYAGRAFKASKSPEPFLDHVAIAIVPEAIRARHTGTAHYEELRQWLRDDRLPRKHFRKIANKHFRHDDLALTALIEEFCLLNLPRVIELCSYERLFWPYCLVSFRRFVVHRYEDDKLDDDRDAPGEPVDPGDGADENLTERQLLEAKKKEFALVQVRWYGEELRRHKKRPAPAGATPWVDAAEGIPPGLDRKCAKCVRLWVFWLSVGQWSHREIAEHIGITPNYSKVLRTRALHQLRLDLARYPVALVPSEIDGTWRVRLNRWAFWPTAVSLSSTPEDLATIDPATITIAEGSSRSAELIHLRPTPYATSRPTACVFDTPCAAGASIVARVLMDHALLIATANRRSAQARVGVPNRSGRPVAIHASSASPSVRIRRASFPVGPGQSSVEIEVETTTSGPQPASLHFDPAAMVGGIEDDDDVAKVVVQMGGRVVVEGEDGSRVEGVLPIIPTPGTVTPVALTSADPSVLRPCVSEWHADAAAFDIEVEVDAVAKTRSVEITASAGGGSTTGALSILPPPIESFSVSAKSLPAGASVPAVIEFARPLVAPTEVELIRNHGGVRFDRSPCVVPAGATSMKLTVLALDEAQSGPARLVAAANESEAAATIVIVANAISGLKLKPEALTAGSRATASITCLRAVKDDVPLRMRANGAVKLVDPATVIPAGRDRMDFEIEALDVERHCAVDVEIEVFGTSVSAELRISPAKSSRQLRGEPS